MLGVNQQYNHQSYKKSMKLMYWKYAELINVSVIIKQRGTLAMLNELYILVKHKNGHVFKLVVNPYFSHQDYLTN